MADLGALLLSFPPPAYPVAVTASHPAFSTLGVAVDASNGHRAVAAWLEQTVAPDPFPVHPGGYLAGTVTAESTPVPYATVRVYYRPTGVQVASVRADNSGNFRIDGLPTDAAAYYAIAFDPDGGVLYNAAIFDRLTPVMAQFTTRAFTNAINSAQYGAASIALATPTDPNWGDVVLLMHLNGTNGSTTFTDERSHAMTAGGNAQISTAQSKFDGASALFDGSGDYISAPDSADWDFGTGNFTIEMFVRFVGLPSGGAMTLIGNYFSSSNGWALQFRNDGGTGRVRFTWGDSTLADFNWTPSTGVWYHLAVSRSGTALRAFIDGTQIGADTTYSTDLSGGLGTLQIGALLYSGSYIQGFNGYLDELRITKGVARYTANFTPPSAAFPAG